MIGLQGALDLVGGCWFCPYSTLSSLKHSGRFSVFNSFVRFPCGIMALAGVALFFFLFSVFFCCEDTSSSCFGLSIVEDVHFSDLSGVPRTDVFASFVIFQGRPSIPRGRFNAATCLLLVAPVPAFSRTLCFFMKSRPPSSGD